VPVGPYFLDPLERKAIIRPLASLYADWYGPEKRKRKKEKRKNRSSNARIRAWPHFMLIDAGERERPDTLLA
jgi:hypothetical protein